MRKKYFGPFSEGLPPRLFPSPVRFLFTQKLRVNPLPKKPYYHGFQLKWYIFSGDLLAVFRVLTQEMYKKKGQEADPLILRTVHARPFRIQESSTTVHTKGSFPAKNEVFTPRNRPSRDPPGPKILLFSLFNRKSCCFVFFNRKSCCFHSFSIKHQRKKYFLYCFHSFSIKNR